MRNKAFLKRSRILWIICFLLIAVIKVHGQMVTGTVRSLVDNQPLPGVTVHVNSTQNGTVTDNQGEFSLDNVTTLDTLTFSFVGYGNKIEIVGDRSQINVDLAPIASRLDQVIVIGYGATTKKDLTGSVAHIEGDKFKDQPMTQVTDMLTGTVSGLTVTQSTAASGAASGLEIRGPNSLSAGTSPLIVVDGVIYRGSISAINPFDIESIDVLKDASSAAVYGASAASGVILVTTRRGKTGKATINFSSNVGFAETARDYRPLDAEQFLQFRSDFFTEGILDDPTMPSTYYRNPDNLPNDVSKKDWLNYRPAHSSDPHTEYLQRLKLTDQEIENEKLGKVTNWYDLVMRKGLRQTYNIGINGGTEDIKYYWSLGYDNNKGIIRGDRFSILRSTLNVEFNITEWLTIGNNSKFSIQDNNSIPANLSGMNIMSPFGEAFNEDGTVRIRPWEDPGSINPLVDALEQNKQQKTNTLQSNLFATVSLPLDIQYKLSFQPLLIFDNQRNFWGENTLVGTQTHPDGYATRVGSKTNYWLLDNIITWNKRIGIHDLDITVLYSSEKNQSWSETLSNEGFLPNGNLQFHGIQFGNDPHVSANDNKYTGASFMSRVNYGLLDKYLFSFSYRRDGFSAFGQQNPWANFPSAAFAWRISEEDFFDHINWINDLKLRFSWGLNGNRNIGQYASLSQLSSSMYYDGNTTLVGLSSSTLPNASLKWERTEALNVGIDLSAFNNRISMSVDAYKGNTKDLLMTRTLPLLTGFSSVVTNLGKLDNKGVEVNVNTINISNSKLQWNSDVNFYLNRNKIVSLFGDMGEYTLLGQSHEGELPDFDNEWFPGRSIDIVWNYVIDGIWQIDEEKSASDYNLHPGDYKAIDFNEDNKYVDVEDKRFIGYSKPRYHLGVGNTLSYNNFSLNVFVRSDFGFIRNYDRALQGTLEHDRRNYAYAPMPYWTPENGNNEYPRLRPINTAFGGGLHIYKPSSFIRLQDVSLSYNFSGELIRKIRLNNLNVFVAAKNLVTLTKWPGWDPESGMTPMPKSFSIGVNLSL